MNWNEDVIQKLEWNGEISNREAKEKTANTIAMPIVIEPVLLNHAFRTAFIEIWVIPAIVAPHPHSRPVTLDRADEEHQVVPPEFACPAAFVHELRLVANCFFIETDMEIARIAENGHYISDNVFTDFVVFRRTDHPAIFLHPAVMRL